MEQLEIPLGRYRKYYRSHTGPRCPCCKQNISRDEMLISWQEFRNWLHKNWDQAAVQLMGHLAYSNPAEDLDLRENPDLLYALKTDAQWENLPPKKLLIQILDGYYDGEFDRLIRRGKKLVLPTIQEDL